MSFGFKEVSAECDGAERIVAKGYVAEGDGVNDDKAEGAVA